MTSPYRSGVKSAPKNVNISGSASVANSPNVKASQRFGSTPKRRSESSSPKLSPNSTCDLNRVHEELEKLNIATDVINKLELQLDEARSAFREIQSSWSQKLEQLSKKLGGCIDKSRPYYEARLKVLEAQQEAQRAVLRFERANSMHTVAKQQVTFTQESLNRQGPKNVDPACLEVLNHHIQRVNEAEIERLRSEEEHQAISRNVVEATSRVAQLEHELKRTIRKSKPYFDTRVEFTKVLEKQKELIGRLEAEIKQKKCDYNTSLRNLETISEQIHQQRHRNSGAALGDRDPGVGSETPEPPVDSRISSEMDHQSRQQTMHVDHKKIDVKKEEPVVPERENGFSKKHPSMVPASLASCKSGVILLAQELSIYDWIKDETRDRAFTFPPEDLDLRYQTAPEGVKPFPSPPETPRDPVGPPDTPNSSGSEGQPRFSISNSWYSHSNNYNSRLPIPRGSNCNETKSLTDISDASSITSFGHLDDELIENALKEPAALIREMNADFLERSSGSGAEDPA